MHSQQFAKKQNIRGNVKSLIIYDEYYNNYFDAQIDGEIIDWAFYKTLYDVDSKLCLGGKRVCPKLTPEHIEPNNMLKMRVFLAVQVSRNFIKLLFPLNFFQNFQVFSQSVANGLKMYADSPKHSQLFVGCGPTIKFTEKINNLFDILNIHHKSKGITKESLPTIHKVSY